MSTNAFDDARRSAVYDVIRERRDIRSTFTMDPIDDAALTRVLAAAHQCVDALVRTAEAPADRPTDEGGSEI